MYTLKIEHAIRDFETWRAAFDRDPIGRERAGVREYRIARPADDAGYVLVDLDFERAEQAHAFLEGLRQVWARPEQSPGLGRDAPVPPRTRVVEQVERRAYGAGGTV